MRGLLLAIALLAVVFAVAAYFQRQASRKEAELARLAELDRETTASIVKEVEAIRAQLGRAPEDKEELKALLGRPLPVVHDYGRPTSINYYRTGADSFRLQYELWDTDDWIYDSTIPQAGWVQHWY